MPDDEVTSMPLARIKIDETLYPRKHISQANILEIEEAMRAGKVMPPIVITQRGTIIDGIHRYKARERMYGAEGEIEVVTRKYRNRADMLADALELNTGRGQDLTRYDLLHAAALAEEVGMSMERFARIVGWDVERFADYRKKRVGKTLNDKKINLKRPYLHLINKPLTPAQEEANEGRDGMPAIYHANQLILDLENAMLPPDQENLRDTLLHLLQLIQEWDAAQPPTENTNTN
jgi:ParB-like chromosome segregation protein Spo0J